MILGKTISATAVTPAPPRRTGTGTHEAGDATERMLTR